MVTTPDALVDLIKKFAGPSAFGHDEAERIAQTAIFHEGKLKSFETKPLFDKMTVSSFISLLEALNAHMLLGSPDLKPECTWHYNYRWNPVRQVCEVYATYSCCF